MLFDDPRNRQSEVFAFQADTLLRQGDLAAAREHYARAAVLETELLDDDAALRDPRAFNIVAVSAVALWKKAGRPDKVEELASRLLLRAADLSPYAFRELRTMRDEARAAGPDAHA